MSLACALLEEPIRRRSALTDTWAELQSVEAAAAKIGQFLDERPDLGSDRAKQAELPASVDGVVASGDCSQIPAAIQANQYSGDVGDDVLAARYSNWKRLDQVATTRKCPPTNGILAFVCLDNKQGYGLVDIRGTNEFRAL